MAPLTVPNRMDPCVGVDISPGCLITSEPIVNVTSQKCNRLPRQLQLYQLRDGPLSE